MAKSQQIKRQIAASQQQNRQYAIMLTILLQQVEDELLLGLIFSQLTEYDLSVPAIFAQFLPVLQTELTAEQYTTWYDGEIVNKLPNFPVSISALVEWLEEVRTTYEEMHIVPMDIYVRFVLRYLVVFEVVTEMSGERRGELEQVIKDAL
jgi:hypothetical protein